MSTVISDTIAIKGKTKIKFSHKLVWKTREEVIECQNSAQIYKTFFPDPCPQTPSIPGKCPVWYLENTAGDVTFEWKACSRLLRSADKGVLPAEADSET